MMKKNLKAAFPVTIPVLLGYLSVGIAFGLLFEKTGLPVLWAVLMSVIVYAGSMQFIAVCLLTGGVGLVNVALMALFVNIRHMFYGLSFLDKFKDMGRKKPYMIFSLTDETYSLLCGSRIPDGIDSKSFYFYISFLNQLYWITGTLIGVIAGKLIRFNTTGIDFAMTALFVVIFIEQWHSYKSHVPVLIGLIAPIVALYLFGASNMILPSMLLITAILMGFRRPIEKTDKAGVEHAGR